MLNSRRKRERGVRNKSHLREWKVSKFISTHCQDLHKDALQRQLQAAELFTWRGFDCPAWEVRLPAWKTDVATLT